MLADTQIHAYSYIYIYTLQILIFVVDVHIYIYTWGRTRSCRNKSLKGILTPAIAAAGANTLSGLRVSGWEMLYKLSAS